MIVYKVDLELLIVLKHPVASLAIGVSGTLHVMFAQTMCGREVEPARPALVVRRGVGLMLIQGVPVAKEPVAPLAVGHSLQGLTGGDVSLRVKENRHRAGRTRATLVVQNHGEIGVAVDARWLRG